MDFDPRKVRPSDNPVLRANASKECQLPIGQLNIAIKGGQRDFETVSFYCTQPKHHRDACRFEGKDLVITRRPG